MLQWCRIIVTGNKLVEEGVEVVKYSYWRETIKGRRVGRLEEGLQGLKRSKCARRPAANRKSVKTADRWSMWQHSSVAFPIPLSSLPFVRRRLPSSYDLQAGFCLFSLSLLSVWQADFCLEDSRLQWTVDLRCITALHKSVTRNVECVTSAQLFQWRSNLPSLSCNRLANE